MKLKKPKKGVKKSSMKLWNRGSINAGMIYAVAAMFLFAALGMIVIGGIQVIIPKSPIPSSYACCDSGDGADCHPLADKQITFNGEVYGLLKSNIYQWEGKHVDPAGPDQYANPSTGEGRIFLNTTDHNHEIAAIAAGVSPDLCKPGQDFLWMTDNSCFGIPNDQLIYVCRASKSECAKAENKDTMPFDVYFRMRDFTGTIPPQMSMSCARPGAEDQKIVDVKNAKGEKNLQLETFNVETGNKWFSIWCKPAVYLYPKERTQVHVVVEPKGEMNYTIPLYPKGGWDVTAYPDGRIVNQGKTYPYLYWEAAISDSLIIEPKTGYVVTSKELASLFATVLPRMGLNEKESSEFSEYWVKALPASPYYFVGIVPEGQINYLAPLTIKPSPDSLLRVSFYFKTLDKKMEVEAPEFSGFERTGFTVTEWGGFFKADKNHPNFTCLM